MLAALMEDGVLCQSQGRLVVHPKLHCISAKEITQQLSQPKSLSRSVCGSDVLHLATGQATTCCLTDCQLIKHLPRKNVPLVLLIVSMSPVWSLLLYLMKCAAPGHLR
jgi:hypothetical protein